MSPYPSVKALCSPQGLTLTYQKMLVLPMPDYAHRYALWRNLIVAAGGQILKWSDRFDLSSLTKVSDGYTAGHIKYAVEQTLTDRRVIQVRSTVLLN